MPTNIFPLLKTIEIVNAETNSHWFLFFVIFSNNPGNIAKMFRNLRKHIYIVSTVYAFKYRYNQNTEVITLLEVFYNGGITKNENA